MLRRRLAWPRLRFGAFYSPILPFQQRLTAPESLHARHAAEAEHSAAWLVMVASASTVALRAASSFIPEVYIQLFARSCTGWAKAYLKLCRGLWLICAYWRLPLCSWYLLRCIGVYTKPYAASMHIGPSRGLVHPSRGLHSVCACLCV